MENLKDYLKSLADLAMELHKKSREVNEKSNVGDLQKSFDKLLDFVEKNQDPNVNAKRIWWSNVAWPESTFRQIKLPPKRLATKDDIQKFADAIKAAKKIKR